MDLRTPLARSPLPLLLTLLLLLELDRAASEVAVQVLTNVTGLLGNSAYLFCSLALSGNVTVTQVTWMRKNPAGNPTKVAVFHPKKGPSIAESSRVKFLATKLDGDQWNASLSISHLSVTDEGSYECQFATFPTGSRSASVWLEVLAEPVSTVERLEPSPILKEQALAKCISVGGRPPPKIDWLSDLNGTVNETHEPGLLSGTFTVTSTYSSVPSSQVDGKNVTCRVKHESLTKPELKTVTLSSPYPPEVTISGYDDNWYVGLTGVVLTCDAQSKPEPTSYKWSTATGPLPNTTEPQGNQLLINTVDKATLNNVTFLCNVTNALGSGQAQKVIHVKDVEQPRLTTGVIVGIVIGVVVFVAVFIVSAVVVWRYCPFQPSRSNRRSDTEYSAVNDVEMRDMRSPNHGT